VTGRRRAARNRFEVGVTAGWWVTAAGQFLILVGAAALITAVWTGITIPRWVLTGAGILLAVYALGVLSRGRPPAEAAGSPPVAVTARHDGHRR
jgi:hypothetical protein